MYFLICILYFPCALLLCVCSGHACFCKPLERDYKLCLPFEPIRIEDIFSTKTMVQNQPLGDCSKRNSTITLRIRLLISKTNLSECFRAATQNYRQFCSSIDLSTAHNSTRINHLNLNKLLNNRTF